MASRKGQETVIRYGSVCSGIEAATAAWHPLGWQAAWYSEIEPFPSAVLKHHYPTVPNLGDMTKYEAWPDEPIDLLVGGTPCQSFSVAGLRKGLADPRGGLMLTYLEIAQRYRPRWVVWENVPGVLSSNGGRDFGSFLGALGNLGYGWAYRVLDAQWFGVAQRRRRVFVVGHLGDWERAAKVLFESESVRRDTPPNREACDTNAPICVHGSQSPIHEINISMALAAQSKILVCTNTEARWLTCEEWERLQGFPDDYTNIPWRKKDESPDGPRYKALGNSMAVPVMAWIGKRIKAVHEL